MNSQWALKQLSELLYLRSYTLRWSIWTGLRAARTRVYKVKKDSAAVFYGSITETSRTKTQKTKQSVPHRKIAAFPLQRRIDGLGLYCPTIFTAKTKFIRNLLRCFGNQIIYGDWRSLSSSFVIRRYVVWSIFTDVSEDEDSPQKGL
jgi:hypothetical protein